MKTADLIEYVAADGVAKEHTKKILDSALAAVAAAARAGEEVTLAGFGRFKVTERAERQGRIPPPARPSLSLPPRSSPSSQPKTSAMP